jgi:UDP-N-acetylmuramoylalanine--D-glutamate ligase
VITSPAFRGKRYAVLGLARSGLATVDALLASGAEVVAWDDREEARAQILPGTGRGTGEAGGGGYGLGGTHVAIPLHQPAAGPPPRAGEDLLSLANPLEIDLTGFDAIVVTPGLPLNTHPIAGLAKAANVPVIGDIELFSQARAALPPHKVIGITGTNGKSTTTALIHHIVQTAGIPTTLGGNIGLPILGQDPLPEGGIYVLELSSYQIDLSHSLDCDVAVLLNITPDHLDRYDGFAGYAASKERLLDMLSEGHIAVIATEDDATRSIANTFRHCRESGEATLIEVSSSSISDQSQWPTLQGPHNAQNAVAAIAAACALGVPEAAIQQGLKTYPGLPHRMERVATRNGVLFVNDSKATNATATAPALAAYPLIHWILGGLPKTDDLDSCAPYYDHVQAGYVIGQAGPLFARLLRDAGKQVTESGTLDQAVSDAAAAARPGEVVLLSPACASFDQFRDYEARGDAFRAAVEALA